MYIRVILALSTVIGITLGGLLARQTEAGASQNFSRYYIITVEEDSYQSPRKKRKLVKSSTPIKTSQSKPRSMFDLLNQNEALAQAKSKKRHNSTAATAPVKNQFSRVAARRAEIRKYLAAEAARQAREKRKEPEEVFELFNGGESKSKSRLDDSMAVTVVDADKLKKPLAEKAARRAQIKKWLTAEIKVGERDARVPMIRARMVKLGFLSEDNSLAWMLGHPADKVLNPLDLELILDKELSKAIKAFQKGNGIKQTGRIDKATVAALNAPEAEEQRKAQEAALALAKQRQAAEAERLAAEVAEKQRQAAEAERLAAEVAAKQRQAAEAERLAAEAAEKQRQAEETERQRLAAEVAAKQRQAEEAERQRLAAEVAEKQRQAEETERQRLAAEVAAKQRQAEEARRLAHNRKVASLDSASGAKETLSKSCNKAQSIIGKWGFEDIETNSCTGKVYHFSATRKGKRFSVKINALTSELIEVKRVLSSAAQ